MEGVKTVRKRHLSQTAQEYVARVHH
jgi:hypothetical protein